MCGMPLILRRYYNIKLPFDTLWSEKKSVRHITDPKKKIQFGNTDRLLLYLTIRNVLYHCFYRWKYNIKIPIEHYDVTIGMY